LGERGKLGKCGKKYENGFRSGKNYGGDDLRVERWGE
jgi:hypothetical protein